MTIIDDAIATNDDVIARLQAMITPAPIPTPTGALLLDSIVNKAAWRSVGQYNTQTVVDGLPFKGTVVPQQSVTGGITAAWCGAAFDYDTGTMHIVVPGGHNDSWNNQCYAWQDGWSLTADQTAFPPDRHVAGYLPTNRQDGQPTRGDGFYLSAGATGPIQVSPYVDSGAVYFDGAPCSRHTYGATVYLPTQKRVLLMSGSTWSQAGGYDFYCGWFDPLTGKWERKGNVPHGSSGTVACHWRDKVIYLPNGTNYAMEYDPATDKHRRFDSNLVPWTTARGHPFVQCCVAGDYLYAVCKNGWLATFTDPANAPMGLSDHSILRIKLGQTSAPWQFVNVSGDVTAVNGVSPGMEYDPDRNALVFWSFNDPANISLLSLTDFSLSKQSHGQVIDVTGTTTGVWGRFRRLAKDTYVLFVKSTLPVYVLKLS